MKIRHYENGATYNGEWIYVQHLAPKYKKRAAGKTTPLKCIHGVTYRKQLTGDYYNIM